MALDVIEERHEAEVHVQLLVAVEEREAGVVSGEDDLGLLVATYHDDILKDAGSGLSGDLGQLEASIENLCDTAQPRDSATRPVQCLQPRNVD